MTPCIELNTLVLLLPDGLVNDESNPAASRHVSWDPELADIFSLFRRTPSLADLDKLLESSSSATGVRIGGDDLWALDLLDRLFRLFPNNLLFPGCTQLEFQVSECASLDCPLARELIARCEKLSIRGARVDSRACRDIAQNTQGLRELEVDGSSTYVGVSTSLELSWFEIIVSRNKGSLRTVSMSGMPQAAMGLLSSVPLLETLIINDRWAGQSYGLQDLISLRHLHCLGSCGDITAILGQFRLPALESLEITCSHGPPPRFVGEVFACMSYVGPKLQRFSLRTSGEGKGVAVISDDWLPLFRFNDMRHFSISGGGDIDFAVDENTIFELTKAWPSIEILVLPCNPFTSSFLTIESLIIIASACPNLRTLHVPLSGEDVHTIQHPLAYTMELGYLVSNLTELGVGVPPCHSPAETAGFLTNLFPHLTKLVNVDPTEADTVPAEQCLNWMEVVQQVQTRFDPPIPRTETIQLEEALFALLDEDDEMEEGASQTDPEDLCAIGSQDDEWIGVSTPSSEHSQEEWEAVMMEE